MNTYKMVVAYDGTDFHGWQIQPTDITVTSALQEAWLRLLGQPVSILGASRTDAGVHALGQVARFHAQIPLSGTTLLTAWNAQLPSAITIRSLATVDYAFHPCGNVEQKTYFYTLFLQRPLPLVARFGWHYKYINQVDIPTFIKCLQLYVGTHDFASFCKPEHEGIATIRTIDHISVRKLVHHNALIVCIKGPSFVRFQIRRMIGYALDLARKPQHSIDYLKDILYHPNPQQTLIKADSKGLCLRKILYNDAFNNR